MQKFKGWEGSELVIGKLEGGNAPILVVRDGTTTVSFCPEDPDQVTSIISALKPYAVWNPNFKGK